MAQFSGRQPARGGSWRSPGRAQEVHRALLALRIFAASAPGLVSGPVKASFQQPSLAFASAQSSRFSRPRYMAKDRSEVDPVWWSRPGRRRSRRALMAGLALAFGATSVGFAGATWTGCSGTATASLVTGQALPGGRCAAFHGIGRRCLRQRHVRELLRHARANCSTGANLRPRPRRAWPPSALLRGSTTR